MLSIIERNNEKIYFNFSLFSTQKEAADAGASIVHHFKNNFILHKQILENYVVLSPLELKNFYSFTTRNSIKEYFDEDSFKKEEMQFSKFLNSTQEVAKKNVDLGKENLREYVEITIPGLPGTIDAYRSAYYNFSSLLNETSIYFNRSGYNIFQYLVNSYLFYKHLDPNSQLIKGDIKQKSSESVMNLSTAFLIKGIPALEQEQNLISYLKVGNIFLNNSFQFWKKYVIPTLEDPARTEGVIKNIIEGEEKTPIFPLFYRIKKIFKGTLNPFQEIYISPNLSVDPVTYIDTQILPNQEYTYDVEIIALCLGYKEVEMQDPNDKTKKIKKYSEAYVIAELPYFKGTPEINSIYPLIPEPKIYTLLNHPNNLKIFLNTKTAYEKPRPFDNSDINFEKVIDKEVFFTNGDIESFIIYRSENPATVLSYSSRYAVLNYPDNCFIDNIEYNKEYYYAFTSYDGKNYSNNSDIIKVIIQNINGSIVPKVETYNNISKINENLNDIKSFKQRVSVAPSTYQLNLEYTDGENPPSYKDMDGSNFSFDLTPFKSLESIFGVKDGEGKNTNYKIRITSKSSGRSIDVNLNFKYRIKNNVKK